MLGITTLSAPADSRPGRERVDLEPEPADTLRILDQELGFARALAVPVRGTWVLLGIIGAVFLILTVMADVMTAQMRPALAPGDRVPYELLVLLGAKNNAAIASGEVWRLGTSMLLHGNLLHLLVNAYALYVLGIVLERLYGLKRFFALFFVSGMGGALASYLFTTANSVGASGAIFGLLGAAVVYGVKFRGLLPARIRRMLTVGLLPWVVLNLFIGTAFTGIDNSAHVGGLVTGCAMAALLGTRLREGRRRSASLALWAVLIVAVGYMSYAVVGAVVDSAPCVRTVPALEACRDRLAGSAPDGGPE